MSSIAARQVPLLDLRAQHARIRDEVLAAIVRVVDAQKFILGEEVQRLEQELAPYCGAEYAVGCASGTDALTLALMALGIGPGDEVLTVPFTFFATAGTVARMGARPVFVDIEPATFQMDMTLVERALDAHPAVHAIIPVHLFGACADMNPLLEIAAQRGIPVIEDAAQSIGSEYQGRRAGSMGLMGCFSFFPSKNLGAYGDAGMVTTNDPEIAARLRSLRVHGESTQYVHEQVGMNSRLDALQAAVLRVKFRYLDQWSARRQENASAYRGLLAHFAVPVTVGETAAYQSRHIYNQFVIRCPDRDRLKQHLERHGIGCAIYYPIPLHLQKCFADLGYEAGDLPVSERAAAEVLALPVNPEVSAEDIEYVCQTIAAFYADRRIPIGQLCR
ncbi:MAG: DegT/DnrJ/EryC1/StrS family aminotransferase [Acidobacteriia bacterium]|nr:DegT/DnrJ/EryC1/StrS family aminotransferase [Terriglobia bacterium]